MKKNHPQRHPETQRKTTVRPDRILSDRPQRRSAYVERDDLVIKEVRDHGSNYRGRIAIVAAAIVLLVIAIPLSCRLIPPGKNDQTSQTFAPITDSNVTSADNGSSEPTDTSTDLPTSETTAATTPAETTEVSETSTTISSSETQPSGVPDYPMADKSLLPAVKQYSEAEIGAVPSVIYGWSFNRPAERHKNLPASLAAQIQESISPFAVIWQMPKTDKPTVYLTMDEGYEYSDNTTRILNTAQDKQVGITFFITGDFIGDHPELVKRMLEEGHQIANHSVNHPSLPKLLQSEGADAMMQELYDLEKSYEKLTGAKLSRLIRPPMGEYSPQMLAVLNNNGFIPVFWSFAYVDWYVDNQPVPSAALDQILGELHDGSVILIHAVSKTNVEILPELIDGIRERGYEISLLPSL
ncbi:MAG: polysaccharide deacetylase family protein [Clostridiaceae bacterium]|nr:polysaccharide deacetylase family protein [Clostridiaceae bacterium]